MAALIVGRRSPQRPQRPTIDADGVRVRSTMDEEMSPEWRTLRSSVGINPRTADARRMEKMKEMQRMWGCEAIHSPIVRLLASSLTATSALAFSWSRLAPIDHHDADYDIRLVYKSFRLYQSLGPPLLVSLAFPEHCGLGATNRVGRLRPTTCTIQGLGTAT
ncbi:hypothetical protein BO78DRAFT_415026 [Aspergillus sclerotiicarbonarius CBS 121057]|uniref:Uncharacterized protein n=1 Tax=Aspergillus sclerotiicarbonarius (strain CBS 121057 / IBT 28362) TaxID=1448318 RepID=A0A319EJ31_ASPSB|nr:hypothetical protein BO78DRAFT_415026 [Aspergillus sclerotiicarbonarius CBS 121057]